MIFNSLSFLWSFAGLFFVYYCIPKRLRFMRNLILLGYSLLFYAWGGPKFLVVMLNSITINYLCGLLAEQNNPQRVRRAGVFLAGVLGFGMLIWFKYSGFLAQIMVDLGMSVAIPNVVMPIGISFFTFQGFSYVLDVYRGDAPAQHNPLSLALYISLFPQLVAGPIVRYTTVEIDITDRCESSRLISDGATRFLFGLGKKMILANSMAQIADAVFDQQPNTLYVGLAWLGALAYTAQIYLDFSAYSDMAIGLGKIFGFHFLENFNYPYVSRSISEFWRRWHISLSSWFRDYVYIPLGGNRCSTFRHICNIAVVWLLTGLWHGASWTYVAWGVWYLILLLGEKYLWGVWLTRIPNLVQCCITMTLGLRWMLLLGHSIRWMFHF